LARVEQIGDSGSVVVYYASFEKKILSGLAQDYPEMATEINAISARIWDLWEVIRDYVEHPDFQGSNSIKYVLPVLVPELTYKSLEVSNGKDAQAVWNQFIRIGEGDTKAQMRTDLLEYCKLDTLAMVKILEVLKDLSSSTSA